ncbi:hypothetical protein K458DRAFT_471677 [Lentithecium fluviatile CBS 122367]|uniref:Major facilitator superfamily (MFS) profile domain-containing protein n=1 Tax=Lentithecium fluviatile CBS 122367 TaxID=1168545 RepID=A0A6G1J7P8_9PLEO|nr:hypothetical protein K458DRAFT_471677 [Lentithecium fluviatile CBS 122367]
MPCCVYSVIHPSGIDGVLYYALTIFTSFLASSVSAILMLVFSIPATLFADKWGRRTSAICSGIILLGSMFLVGSLYAANAVHSYGVAR